MTDSEWIANIHNFSNSEIFEQLENCGCDGYYRDIWNACIEELQRRVNNPSGDSISREWVIHNVLSLIDPETRFYVKQLIDDAPAVPEKDYSQGWHDAITKALNEAYTITSEDGSFKVVQTETLEGLGMSMPMPVRPHGKWIYKQIHDYGYWECDNCGELCTEGTPKTMNFCPNCGAKMRGGAE